MKSESASSTATRPATEDLDRPLDILFVMMHGGFVRNYESVIRMLGRRGHRIHIAIQQERTKLGDAVLGKGLAGELDTVTFGSAPEPEATAWSSLAWSIRALFDYLRYLVSDYRQAFALRARVKKLLPWHLRATAQVVGVFGDTSIRMAYALLQWIESLLPLSTRVQQFLKAQDPALVLITPLVEFASSQVEYVKAARALGMPTALCVASWDNLTNKGLMRVIPDRVFVWNEAQKAEAVTLHRVPADRVVVTGAQLFDQWFERQPSRSREEFCSQVGLPAEKPFVLYLGSSYFIAPREADFGEQWIQEIRGAGDHSLRDLGILIRPHPKNAQQWLGLDFSQLGHTVIWPPFGADPFTEAYKADYFDSLYYSAAVVGVNTSAMIEAGIVGRSVCTIQTPEFAHSQAGTLHFQHLVGVNGGLVHQAEDFETHLSQLARAVKQEFEDREQIRHFVEGFVRPHGLTRAATPILGEAIERAAVIPVAAIARDARPALRAGLYPLALLASWLVPNPAKKQGKTDPTWVRVLRPLVALWVRLVVLRIRIAAAGARRDTRRARPRFRLELRETVVKPILRLKRPLHHLQKRARHRLVASLKSSRRVARQARRHLIWVPAHRIYKRAKGVISIVRRPTTANARRLLSKLRGHEYRVRKRILARLAKARANGAEPGS